MKRMEKTRSKHHRFSTTKIVLYSRLECRKSLFGQIADFILRFAQNNFTWVGMFHQFLSFAWAVSDVAMAAQSCDS
jgi:hypothetical protein